MDDGTGVEQAHDLRMSFGEHLEELRTRIILSLVGVVVCCTATLYFGKQILAWLCVPLIQAQRAVGVPPQAYALSPLSGFAIYLKVSLVAAVILAVPWILFQAWRFIESGLYHRERLAVLIMTPFSTVMTILGVVFAYYVMLPVCLWFFLSFSTSYPQPNMDRSFLIMDLFTAAGVYDAKPDTVQKPPHPPQQLILDPKPGLLLNNDALIPVISTNPSNPVDGQMWLKIPERELRVHYDGQTRSVSMMTPSMLSPLIEIDRYIDFVTMTTIGCLAAFQLPVVMLVLGWSGLVQPAIVARYRRYCVFGCFVLGTLLTPTDILSMLLMSLPLWGLFELGLILMKIAGRRNRSAAGTA